MSNRKHTQQGFALVETILVVVIIAAIAFVGWFVYNAKQNSDKSLDAATTTSNNAGPNFATKKAATTSNGTDNASLQTDLDGVNSANGQSSKDLSTANSGLSDQSTFTSVPQ